jgi:hypothetical protein
MYNYNLVFIACIFVYRAMLCILFVQPVPILKGDYVRTYFVREIGQKLAKLIILPIFAKTEPFLFHKGKVLFQTNPPTKG